MRHLRQQNRSLSLTWGWKQIQFPKRCVLQFLRILEHGQSPKPQYLWQMTMVQNFGRQNLSYRHLIELLRLEIGPKQKFSTYTVEPNTKTHTHTSMPWDGFESTILEVIRRRQTARPLWRAPEGLTLSTIQFLRKRAWKHCSKETVKNRYAIKYH
jgi:hypothetical protein